MKKIFLLMAVIATALLLNVSCKKDDKKEPQDVATWLVGDWQGYVSGYKKNNSQWDFNNERNYAVVRFVASSNGAKNGTGYQLEFKNEHMVEQTGFAEFFWKLEDENVRISYKTEGWGDVYFNFNDCELTASVFRGEMYDYTDHKYVFDFVKTSFSDWAKYMMN
ncbi:MAG: hypothetical protein IJV06_05090 [Bacteroidaceae bacterium]|nr:hypothetical protein [Bacteroidaceae bacterium]